MGKAEKRFEMRVGQEEYERWVEESRKLGIAVAEWIRRKCEESSPKESNENGANPDLRRDEGVRVGGQRADGAKCVHGMAKGYHCWQCRGAAKVEGGK